MFEKLMLAVTGVLIIIIVVFSLVGSPDRTCKDQAETYVQRFLKPLLEQGRTEATNISTDEVSYVSNEKKCYAHLTITSTGGEVIGQLVQLNKSDLEKSPVVAEYVLPTALQNELCSPSDPCMNKPAFDRAVDRVFGR